MDNPHVEAIASKHQALHAKIDQEEHRPHPDIDLLHRLKKEKLRLKDALLGH
ncbi:MAG: YdcH family protein [Sphingomicrobium sp.]